MGERELPHRLARVLNTFQPGTLSQDAFESLQEQKTVVKYLQTWKRLVCYYFRVTVGMVLEGVTVFKATSKQKYYSQQVFDALKDSPTTDETHLASEEELERYQERLDAAVIGLGMAFIKHTLPGNPFESVMLSFCAALCLKADESGLMEAHQFSPYLSQLVYCVQLIILASSLQKKRMGLLRESFATHLTGTCRTWLLNDSEGPMGEILSQRLYTLAASYSEGTPAKMTWSEDGTTVTYNTLRVSMEDIRKLLRDQMKAAKALLENELLFKQKFLDLQGFKLTDNWGERKPRYNFLHDSRSESSRQYNLLAQWVLKGNNAVLVGLAKSSNVGGSREWVSSSLQKYEVSVQHFLEHLLVLVHVSAGQPGRGKEILGTRYLNTLSGVRNLLWYNESLMLAMPYHKSQAITKKQRYVGLF